MSRILISPTGDCTNKTALKDYSLLDKLKKLTEPDIADFSEPSWTIIQYKWLAYAPLQDLTENYDGNKQK